MNAETIDREKIKAEVSEWFKKDWKVNYNNPKIMGGDISGFTEYFVDNAVNRTIDLTLAARDASLANSHEAPSQTPTAIIERIEELAFPDTIKEQKDGYVETLVIRKDEWEALKKEFFPAELDSGQGVRGQSADASVASVKELDLPPEKSAGDQKITERQSDLIEKIRSRVVSRMHTDDGGYDSTAEDIRKMLVGFDRGD